MISIDAAKAKKTEQVKMTDWNTPYVPAGLVEGRPKTRRQTPRQARASALVAKAKANALRLMAQGE